MATCSEISFQSTPETDHFIRLTRLLIKGGTPILRDALKHYHTPQSLTTCLKSTRKITFTKPEKERVYPPSGRLPNFEEFDISLIFKFFNCCKLAEPVTKWNEMPQESDCSLEADMVRIYVYRNQIYAHTTERMALTQDEFEKYWVEISDVLCRMAYELSGSNYSLKDSIEKLRNNCLTSDDHRIAEQFCHDIMSSLAHHEEKLENIEAKEDEIKQNLEGIQDSIQRCQLGRDQSSAVTIQYKPVNVTINQSTPSLRGEPLESPPGISAQELIRTYSEEEARQIPNKQATSSRPLGEQCSPSPLTDEAASKTDTFFSLYDSANQDVHRVSGHPNGAERPHWDEQTVSSQLFDRNEYSPQHQNPFHFDQDPLLRIKISLPRDLGIHLGKLEMRRDFDEQDEMSQFYHYLQDARQLTIKKVTEDDVTGDQSLWCIHVTPRDLKSLEDLWHDYIMNDLNEFVKHTLLPDNFSGDVDVHIDSYNYGQCCKSLKPREFKDSGRILHSRSSEFIREETPHLNIPRSTSVIDLSKNQTNAIEELFLLICKNGGTMKWQEAKGQLTKASYMEVVRPAFKDNTTGYFKFLSNNNVQANVSIKFCPKRRGKVSSCEDRYCPDLHLCPYNYILDRCNFPTNCKNSHDICDDHTTYVLKNLKVNLASLNRDERLQILKNVAYLLPEICIYYNSSTKLCRNDLKCSYLHVCKCWALSKCREKNCPRAHTLRGKHEQDILKKYNLQQMTETEVVKELRDHSN